jgi:hypothetical protein
VLFLQKAHDITTIKITTNTPPIAIAVLSPSDSFFFFFDFALGVGIGVFGVGATVVLGHIAVMHAPHITTSKSSRLHALHLPVLLLHL